MLALGALVWFWRPLNAWGTAGAAYGARVACSCRHIQERSLGDCRNDFKPGMTLIRLSEDAEARSVTASLPLLVSQTATFRPGEGCLLEPWEDRS